MSIHTTQTTTRIRDTLPLHSPNYINNNYPESKMNNLRTFVHHSIPGSRDIKQFVVQRFSANHEDGLLSNFLKSPLKFFTKSDSSHSLFNSEFANFLSPLFLFSFSFLLFPFENQTARFLLINSNSNLFNSRNEGSRDVDTRMSRFYVIRDYR